MPTGRISRPAPSGCHPPKRCSTAPTGTSTAPPRTRRGNPDFKKTDRTARSCLSSPRFSPPLTCDGDDGGGDGSDDGGDGDGGVPSCGGSPGACHGGDDGDGGAFAPSGHCPLLTRWGRIDRPPAAGPRRSGSARANRQTNWL